MVWDLAKEKNCMGKRYTAARGSSVVDMVRLLVFNVVELQCELMLAIHFYFSSSFLFLFSFLFLSIAVERSSYGDVWHFIQRPTLAVPSARSRRRILRAADAWEDHPGFRQKCVDTWTRIIFGGTPAARRN